MTVELKLKLMSIYLSIKLLKRLKVSTAFIIFFLQKIKNSKLSGIFKKKKNLFLILFLFR